MLELRLLLLHVPGSYTEPCTGTCHSHQTEPDSGLGLPQEAASHRAPEPRPCSLSLLPSGLPILPVPSLKLGLWSLPLAWRPQLPGSTGKEKLPMTPEASHCFEQAGL